MKNFIRLNLVSFLYSLLILLPFELTMNILRISRLTNLSVSTINTLSILVVAVFISAGTVLIISLIRKWNELPKWFSATSILWLPYFVLFVFIVASLFPTTNLEDFPSSGTGLLAIGMLIVFPFYILFVNFLSNSNK